MLEKRLWHVVALGAGAAAAFAVRHVATTLWRSARGQEPPADPTTGGVTLADALIWAAAVGAGAGVARVVAQRAAAGAWKAATGDEPPTGDRSPAT